MGEPVQRNGYGENLKRQAKVVGEKKTHVVIKSFVHVRKKERGPDQAKRKGKKKQCEAFTLWRKTKTGGGN